MIPILTSLDFVFPVVCYLRLLKRYQGASSEVVLSSGFCMFAHSRYRLSFNSYQHPILKAASHFTDLNHYTISKHLSLFR